LVRNLESAAFYFWKGMEKVRKQRMVWKGEKIEFTKKQLYGIVSQIGL